MKIASVYFQPMIAVISGVPVVLVPQLEISAGISSEVHCNLSSEINQHMDYTIGIKYEDNQWTPINEMNKSFNYSPPQLNCNASARVYIKPQLNISIYNVVAPYLYADFTATPTSGNAPLTVTFTDQSTPPQAGSGILVMVERVPNKTRHIHTIMQEPIRFS